MGALSDFERNLDQVWPAAGWSDLRVLVAVSGGPDSVALLRAIRNLQPDAARIHVAHVDHALRGSDSKQDAEFVRNLANQLGLECTVLQAAEQEIAASAGGTGLESAARSYRYRALLGLAESLGSRYLLTGHTSDDQVETILHRLIRGTGLVGLSGIPRVRQVNQAVSIIRPILSLSRQDVVDYLDELKQAYCFDGSNDSDQFTRNRIRQQLLPLLERDFNPAVRSAILRLGRLVGEAQETIDVVVNDFIEQQVVIAGHEVELNADSMSRLPGHFQREVVIEIWKRQDWPLRQMDFEHWQRLTAASNSVAGTRMTFPGSVDVLREKKHIRLTRRA